MSSKRLGDGSLDLGAQFFTARDPRFIQFLNQHVGADGYGPWEAEFRFEESSGELTPFHPADRYVGVPRMSALTRRLTAALDEAKSVAIHYQCRIARVRRDQGQWYLVTDDAQQLGPFDGLIITAPPVQAADLMADLTPHHGPIIEALGVYRMEPCWAVACGYELPLSLGFDAVRARHPVLGWAARDSSKPQRQAGLDWWVLHAQGDWSWIHREKPADAVIQTVQAAFQERFGITVNPVKTVAHRWLYAKPVTDQGPGSVQGPGYLAYDDLALGFCGDWLSGGRVEGAFQSATGLLAHWQEQDLIQSGFKQQS